MASTDPSTQLQELRSLLRGLPSLAGPLPSFDPDAAPDHPVLLFAEWFQDAVAAGAAEPHVMNLATVDAQGRPAARMLILRDVNEHGFVFGFSAGSPKSDDLAGTPQAALTFYWPVVGRQVRIRGHVVRASPQDSARDFLARSPASRAATLVGRQSQPLGSRTDLDAALQQAHRRIAREPDVVVPDWTLATVQAHEVEFWQGDTERRHIRLRYRRTDGAWHRELLWP